MQTLRADMRFFLFLLLASAASGLSEYSLAFPSVPSSRVLLSCKSFEQGVYLSPLAASEKSFEEPLIHAKVALQSLEKSRQIALQQAGPFFYAGSNRVAFLELSHQCYHHGQEALRQAIQSVVFAAEQFDKTVSEVKFLGGDDPLFKETLQSIEEEHAIIARQDASSPSMGGFFVRALNLTQQAAASPLLLNHAIKTLLDRNGLLEAIVLQVNKFKEIKQNAFYRHAELEEELEDTQRKAQRLYDELAEEHLFLIPESAFSLQKTLYADSTRSYRFPEKWEYANFLLKESRVHQERGKRFFSAKIEGYLHHSLHHLRKALSAAQESLALFEAVKEEVQVLEKNLIAELSSFRPKGSIAVAELESPLPRKKGERIVELSRRLSLLRSTPSDAMEALLSFIRKAESDGVNLEEEKSTARSFETQYDSAELLSLRNNVFEKTRQHYGFLEELYEKLLPYASLVDLPRAAFDGTRLNRESIGNLKKIEIQLREAEKTVRQKAPIALKRAMMDSLRFTLKRESVFLDQPVTEYIALVVENTLPFPGENILLPLPEPLEGIVLREAPEGVQLVQKGLFFSRVAPNEEYVISLERQRVLARRLAARDQEIYSDLDKSRRRFQLTFDAFETTDVFIKESISFVPEDAFSTHSFVFDGLLKAKVSAQQGSNLFSLDYSVSKPVVFKKHVQNGSIFYTFTNRLPVALEAFTASFTESSDCAISSEYFTALGGKAYAAEIPVPLKPFEEKIIFATISCTASNNTPYFPVSNPGLPIFLKHATRWASYSPESSEWLKEAQDAFLKNDIPRYDAAVKKLDALHETFTEGLEAKAKNLCGSCSASIRDKVQDALSALFLSDFVQANALLEEARQLQHEEQERARQQEQEKNAVLEKIRQLSVPELLLFEKAFSSVTARKNPLFEQANVAYRSIQKRLEKLQNSERPIRDLQEDLRKISEDQIALQGTLDGARKEASSSLEVARKANQQFGDPASSLSLEQAEEAFAAGKYAEADAVARQLTHSLQQATPAPKTGLVSSSWVPVGLGVAAVLTLGGLVYYFRYHKPREPLQEL